MGILTEYMDDAMSRAVFDKLEDATFVGRIPPCPGVLAFSPSLYQCQQELRSVLEDWIFVGIKMGHPLPVLGGIDLNQDPRREPVETL